MKNSPSHDWEGHIERTKSKPPRDQLLEALTYFENPPQEVLELGGGALNDAQYLLTKGMNVTVIDGEPATQQMAKEINDPKLHVITTLFDQHVFPVEHYDFVTAMYSLSFNPPDTFMEMMQRMKQSLKKGGIFSGNIFGPKDEWSTIKTMTFLDRVAVENLFSDMELLSIEEIERDNILADGRPKHWHEWKVIARK